MPGAGSGLRAARGAHTFWPRHTVGRGFTAAFPMSNLLARCATLGIVAAGFAATGDLGWLASRGLRLVNARTIPSEQPTADPMPGVPAVPAPQGAGQGAGGGFVLPGGVQPPVAAHASGPEPARHASRAPAEPQPPATGPDRIDLAALRPGERVTVWTGRSGTEPRQRCLAFDIVVPATGEALLVIPGMPPRRVTVRAASGGSATVLAKGASLVVTPLGPARQDRPTGDSMGPVTAIAVGRD